MGNPASSGVVNAVYTTEQLRERINTDFSFALPDREQIGVIQQNTDKFKELANNVINIIPDPVDQYTAVQKLLDCMYWTNFALYKAATSTSGARRAAG